MQPTLFEQRRLSPDKVLIQDSLIHIERFILFVHCYNSKISFILSLSSLELFELNLKTPDGSLVL